MKHISAILVAAALSPVVKGYAQEQVKDSTLNRTVVVENQYNPEVMDAFKVNVLPKVEEPAVAKQHIDYATRLRIFGIFLARTVYSLWLLYMV